MISASSRGPSRYFILAPALLLLTGFAAAIPARCSAIAYDNGVQAGNQAYSGSLGMDFNVLSRPIVITSLGVFDSNADGLQLPVQVAIYDINNSASPLTPVLTFLGSGDALVNGDRFQAINPLELAAGSYSIVAWGYGVGELNGNVGCNNNPNPACLGNINASTVNDGGGLISFTGLSRFGSAGSFPTISDSGPSNRYLAGTFQFADAPEPATVWFIAAGLGVCLRLRRRRR